MNQLIIPIITGTEMEYGYADGLSSLTINDTDVLSRLPLGLSVAGQYLSNGARLYVDMGHKLEYATPECLTIEDVVAAELGGEQIVFSVLNKLVASNKLSPYAFRKCVYDVQGSTWGYHENYLITRKLFDSSLHFPFLMGHFATQSVLTGAGRMLFDEEEGVRVAPSQKMQGITDLIGYSTTTNKALINTRDEPHCDNEIWARQHVVCTDPNLTARMTTLRIGATKLVLRLAEFSEDFDFIEWERITPNNPLQTAHKLGDDHTGRKNVGLINGTAVSALNVQEELLRQANFLNEKIELPADEQEALNLWEEIHDIAKYKPEEAEHVIEFRAQRAFLEAYADRHGKIGSADELTKIRNAWDNLDPAANIGRKWLAADKDEYLDIEKIDHLMMQPPDGTRASKRGNFISNNRKPGEPRNVDDKMEWSRGTINGQQRSFIDPFKSN